MKLPMIFALLSAALTLPTVGRAQDPSADNGQGFTLKVNSNIVLTNIVVRDKKTGAIVRGLTKNDFTIQENGKTQQIESFDFQSVDQAVHLMKPLSPERPDRSR